MKALVTGGAGFIGSHIVDLLVRTGHDVAVVDNLVTGHADNLNSCARFYLVDITSPDFDRVLDLERPEVVFHEAAQMSVALSMGDPVYDARINVLGLLKVLEACVGSHVGKVVFASSGATFGNPRYLPLDEDHPQRPESPYGMTKMVAEHYLGYYGRECGLRWTVLRYGNVYGPRQDSNGEAGVVAIFTRQLLSGETPTIHWDGEQTRDYVYVGDVAQANLLAATAGDGRCYCIGTGVGTSVNQLYGQLCAIVGVEVFARRSPRRPGDLRSAYFDVTRARDELGWQPTVPLIDGLKRTVEFCRAEQARSKPRVGVREGGSW